MTDLEPEPCSVPRCRNDSLFSTVGLVDGRFYAQCYEHALAKAQQEHLRSAIVLDALRSIRAEVPGQGSLL